MRWRFLQSAYIDGRLFNAGEICEMRNDWVPGPFVEPLTPDAAQAFFEAGPFVLGLVRQQFSDLPVTQYPATYWRPCSADKEMWELVGLGRGQRKKWNSDAERGALP